MKREIILLALLLVSIAAAGCQEQPPVYNGGVPAGDSMGSGPEGSCDTDDGMCDVAPSGSTNADIFSDIDRDSISSDMVEYYPGTSGYIAHPRADGTYPAVILIHEWWGLNDNIKTMADLLASKGYVVLAVDLYGESTTDSARAGELAGAIRADQTRAIENMRGAVGYLKSLPLVEKGSIASMGWCFGGGESLQLALSGEQMAATVIYYGNLVDDEEQLSRITWPVLGVFGDEDKSIPPSAVESFRSALDSTGVDYEIHQYPGVGHAFANPSGANYAAKETSDAWEKTLAFLDRNLKGQ